MFRFLIFHNSTNISGDDEHAGLRDMRMRAYQCSVALPA